MGLEFFLPFLILVTNPLAALPGIALAFVPMGIIALFAFIAALRG